MKNYFVIHRNLLKEQINRLEQIQIKIQHFIGQTQETNTSLYRSYNELYKQQEEHLTVLREMYQDIICHLDKSGPPYGRDVFSDRFF